MENTTEKTLKIEWCGDFLGLLGLMIPIMENQTAKRKKKGT